MEVQNTKNKTIEGYFFLFILERIRGRFSGRISGEVSCENQKGISTLFPKPNTGITLDGIHGKIPGGFLRRYVRAIYLYELWEKFQKENARGICVEFLGEIFGNQRGLFSRTMRKKKFMQQLREETLKELYEKSQYEFPGDVPRKILGRILGKNPRGFVQKISEHEDVTPS